MISFEGFSIRFSLRKNKRWPLSEALALVRSSLAANMEFIIMFSAFEISSIAFIRAILPLRKNMKNRTRKQFAAQTNLAF